MTRWSLRTRMVALSAAATLIALAIAGWAMASVLGRFVTASVDQRLDAQLAVMASAVGPDGRVDRAMLDRRLGVLDAGPAWRWRIAGPRGSLGSRDFPALAPHHPHPRGPDGMVPPAPPAPIPLEGSDEHGAIHARQALIATNAGTVTLTAAAPAAVIAQPIRAALVPLLTAVAVLAAIFAAAAWVQLRLGLRPVLALRDQVAAIRRGTRTRVDESQPAELQPLATELNALAADAAATVDAARGSAANLAHALKTPVATLALTVADDAAAAAQVERIERVIHHHLTRARATAVNRRAATAIAGVIADVAGAVRALHPDITLTVTAPDALTVAVDPHDLAEIIGNVLDNAARHARNRVAVTTSRDAQDRVSVAIEDDGPGIPEDRREAAMTAGVRLDEGPVGDGFGLAIVTELVTLYRATIAFGDSAAGGLRVTIAFPG